MINYYSNQINSNSNCYRNLVKFVFFNNNHIGSNLLNKNELLKKEIERLKSVNSEL